MKKVKLLVYDGRSEKSMWVVDTQDKLEAAHVELFQFLDSQGFYEANIDMELLEAARKGDYRAAKSILYERRRREYEGYHFEEAIDPCAKDFGHLPFVQTVVCARSGGKPIKGPWEKIWTSREHGWGDVELWVANQDLKEDFVYTANRAFGKRLMQIVRLGAYPEIVYQEG